MGSALEPSSWEDLHRTRLSEKGQDVLQEVYFSVQYGNRPSSIFHLHHPVLVLCCIINVC
ncbi:unnamed protein product [Ixodes pacificus]